MRKINKVVNTNNISVNSAQFIKNNQGIKVENGTFLKMMTMLINENQDGHSLDQMTEGGCELSIMNTINDKSILDFNEFKNVSMDLDEEPSYTFNGKEEEKTNFETSIYSFMMMNYFNLDNDKINIEKRPIENPPTEGNLSINLKASNNSETVQNNMSKMEATEVLPKDHLLQYNLNVEKLISEIKGNSERQKNKIDLNSNEVVLNDHLFNEDNKVITVSDEASQINSQVLTQLKDKIMIMVDKGPVAGNKIKQVTMELQPHNLGKVDVKIMFEDNKITVEIKALNEETQKILSSNASELANILNKTMESSINVVVKNNGSQYEHQQLSYNQDQEHRYNENYDQDNGHGRQRSFYYEENENKETDEDSAFSELINLRSLKLL